jgi:myo-inositol-1(or 4)-monophosphatase
MSFKGKGDIVTEIDFKSEKFMIDLIEKNFPDHSILSEESGMIDKKSEYVWIMDPIDGTINYYHGVEPFCVGMCLIKNDEPLISAIYNPARDYFYFAEKGKGTTLNGKPVKVSSRSLKDSVIMTNLSSKKEARDRLIPHLEEICSSGFHTRMFGCSFSNITLVAGGKFDVMFSIKTNIWDFFPGVLLIEEAGGRVTDINGNKINIKSTSVLATNGVAHAEMLALLKDI